MQHEGYRKATVESTVRSLKGIARQVNLLEPNAVKEHLSKMQVSESRKERIVVYLSGFYKWKGIDWTAPRYRRIEKLPFIPLESEVDQLISGMGKKTSCFLQLLKETAVRPGEAWNLKWTDIDFERALVNISPEKDSRPRQFKLSNRLIAMINNQPRKWSYIFHNSAIDPIRSLDRFRAMFCRQRKRLARNLGNSRLTQISFKTLRHWKASNEYHKTKDILHVMQVLGHKSIKNTLIYTHLVNFENEDEWISKVAKTVREAQELVENGFDYVCDVEGYKVFRKRK
jgi:integrase